MPTVTPAATGNVSVINGGAIRADERASTVMHTTRYFGQVGRWITYPDGRVFNPHGLDSFATRTPFYPAFFGRDDARLLAEEGFTSLRVGMQPEAIEPQIDAYSAPYVRHYHALDSLLGSYGIGTYLALNQDGYTHRCGGMAFPTGWCSRVPPRTLRD